MLREKYNSCYNFLHAKQKISKSKDLSYDFYICDGSPWEWEVEKEGISQCIFSGMAKFGITSSGREKYKHIHWLLSCHAPRSTKYSMHTLTYCKMEQYWLDLEKVEILSNWRYSNPGLCLDCGKFRNFDLFCTSSTDM